VTISADEFIGAIVPYFGSKRTLAPTIVEEMGNHHTYFEPFCGSCAVLLAKPWARMETVNDLNGDLINLARTIKHPIAGPVFYRRCRRMIMSESEHRAASSRWKQRGRIAAPTEPDIDSAVDYFFSSWVGRNGVTGASGYNQGFAARYTPNGGHGGTRWKSSTDSIPQWRRRMRCVTILNRDGFELLEKLEDCQGVAIYADPPYIEKGADYIHDFETEDHARLAKILGRFTRARVVVSYYDHPSLAELYPGWTIRQTPTTKAMMCGNGRRGEIGAVVAPEVLIINGPSFSSEYHRGLFGAPA